MRGLWGSLETDDAVTSVVARSPRQKESSSRTVWGKPKDDKLPLTSLALFLKPVENAIALRLLWAGSLPFVISDGETKMRFND